MDLQAKGKRKRTVTACSECYRRKQKSIPFGLLSPRDNWSSVGAPDPSISQRYRELLSGLPPNAILADLVDVFFAETLVYSQVLERFYFDKLHSDWLTSNAELTTVALPRDILFFSALVSQVAAVALQFLPSQAAVRGELGIEDHEQCDKLSQTYSNLGEEFMALLSRENPTIVGVQHDLLRAVWFKNSGRGTAAWHVLGSAIRQAQDQGFHLEVKVNQSGGDIKETITNMWYDEYKRRLWVILFVWDSHLAVILNRPRLIHLNDCSAKKPTDCEFPQDPTSCIPKAAGIDEPPSSLAVQLFSYDIGCKVHAMFSSGAHTRHVSSYETVMNLDRDVRGMLERLPPAIRQNNPDTTWDSQCPWIVQQRHTVAVIAHSFLLSLHRNHISLHQESRQAAIIGALTVLETEGSLFLLLEEHQRRLYSLSCYVMDASIFLAYMMFATPTPERQLIDRILIAVSKAADQVASIQDKSPLASCGTRVLSACVQSLHKTWGSLIGCTGRSRLPAIQQPTHECVPPSPSLEPPRDGDTTREPLLPTITLDDRLDVSMFEEFYFNNSLPDEFYVNFSNEVRDLDPDLPFL
ncbi:hypothetical protein Focb16_v003166 [Fusarium oxysporum f. sp. cubense]|uniref:Xylanolytic transcriptional activator regulatory domain-containing protein n=1 Tax=Fusarium oxysporum f. sp. cubense TaxID=61366 RepID=A0A559KMJ1_FUSOC|nr:hypothetical protein Focb16_v003166 [Fusarium oxysporum f. sp. cubense]